MVFPGSPWQPEADLGPSATSGKIALGKCSCHWDHEITNDGQGGVAGLCLARRGGVCLSLGEAAAECREYLE